MHKIIICAFLLSTAGHLAADPFGSTWTAVVQEHVSSGEIDGIPLNVVDYHGIQKDARFEQIVRDLQQFDVNQLKSRHKKLAFWINVYNIAAVKIIIENYPLKSIRDIGNLFSPVWKKNAIIIGGETMTLHHIEHDILRKMDEPRIHFAIVCASVSCPDLRREAFKADSLETQLDEQTHQFLSNRMKGFRLDSDQESVHVSSIFKWFKEDFDGDSGILAFLSRYTQNDVSDYSIQYMPYNWKLNESQ